MSEADCVLVIDDDADIRDSIGDILELRGYRVARAANGREALERLKSGPPPCVILLDLMMPVLNGWEFREQQSRDAYLRHTRKPLTHTRLNVEIRGSLHHEHEARQTAQPRGRSEVMNSGECDEQRAIVHARSGVAREHG